MILDSDDEEDSHEQSIASTNPMAVVGDEVVVASTVILGSGHGSVSSMIPKQNSNRSDENVLINMANGHTEVKMEVNDCDDDIPLIVVQALMNASPNAEPLTNKITHKRFSSKNIGSSSANMQGRSNDTNSPSLSNITSNKSLAKNKKTTQTRSMTKIPAQFISKMPKKLCEYSSNKSTDAERRERRHTVAKPYQSKRCKERFSRLDALQSHAKVHALNFVLGTLKAFLYPGCSKYFTLKTERDAHIKVCNERRYECHICKKNLFADRIHLKQHTRTHSGEKLLLCVTFHFQRLFETTFK